MTPEECVKSRIESFQARLAERNIDLAIITKPVDIYHFSLFNPVVQSMKSFMLIPQKGEARLLLHALRGPHARKESPIQNIVCYAKWGSTPSIAEDPFEALRLAAAESGLSHPVVGAELGALTYSDYKSLRAKLSVRELEDVTGLVSAEKLVKDALAIERLRMAADLANSGMDAMLRALRGGASEIEASNASIARVLEDWRVKYPEYELCGFGTSEEQVTLSLPISCSSCDRIAFGADAPRDYVPRRGDLVLPIVITTVGGYSVENERSLYVGELDGYKTRVFETVIEAHEKALRQVKPGAPMANVFNAAAKVFIDNGFEEFLPGRCGHGMGLSLHEWPSVDNKSGLILEPGMVFTVEPGLMDVTFGGVRPSDTVLVTPEGYENLTDTENGLMKI